MTHHRQPGGAGITASVTLTSCEIRVDTDGTTPRVHAHFRMVPWIPLGATALLASLRLAGILAVPWSWVTAPVWGTFLALVLAAAASVAMRVNRWQR